MIYDSSIPPLYLDSETCGLHGPIVLFQYAIGDGPITLYEPWRKPIQETIKLYEMVANHSGGIVGFNLCFDCFHICQQYTTLLLMDDKSKILEDCVEEYALKEAVAHNGPCWKPVAAQDIMLHARKGPYQSTMDRADIRIRRVPTAIAWQLAAELDRRIKLKDIYFARRKDKTVRWQVHDIKDDGGNVVRDFKDVVLTFAPSSALKVLAADALNLEPDSVLLFADIEPKIWPEELGYAPFAMAIGKPGKWNGAWPECIGHHINHWFGHKLARQYAAKDVELTRRLYQHFGSPALGDDDSELACLVAAVRWHGFQIDREHLLDLKAKAKARIAQVPTAPNYVMRFLQEMLSPAEIAAMHGSTKKVVLEEIAALVDQPCYCDGGECSLCGGKGVYDHPAASRAQAVLDARQAIKEIEIYDKLLCANRFCASFSVIGTLSSRMSGSDQLNAQGIKKTKEVRRGFPLAWPGAQLSGGDFSGFEVVLAEACFADANLRRDLLSGKKIHALFGQFVFPDLDYDAIIASQGSEHDVYTKSKSAVFAMLYGGEGVTLKNRLGVDLETADEAYQQFCRQYPGVDEARRKVADMFCTLRQPGGLGTKVEWSDPADYIESMFGFRRYFTLENQIEKVLFDLANKPPKAWADLKVKVVRRDRVQTAMGAVQSALYGAVFSMQAACCRAANNHVIQSSGAQITKRVQRRIWDLQPSGVNPWRVCPMNIHDEIMCVVDPQYVEDVAAVVNETVEGFRERVPLIKMEWAKQLQSWADKS